MLVEQWGAVRAAGVGPRRADHVERRRVLREVAVERERAVDADGPPGGARDRLRPHRTRGQGRSARLHRWRPDRVGTFERRLTGPDAPHRHDLLVHALPAVVERGGDGPVVVLAAAHTEADGQPAGAQDVDRRHLLGDGHRVVRGEDHDRRPEPHPLGQGGGRRELHRRFMARVRDALGDGQARPRTLVGSAAPPENFVAAVRQHRRQGHRDVHAAPDSRGAVELAGRRS